MGRKKAPAKGRGGGGTSATNAVENGIVDLFSTRLLAVVVDWHPFDLILVCVSVFMLQVMVEGSAPASRVTGALRNVAKGVVLNSALDAAGAIDLPLYMAHLLCIFLMLNAFEASWLGSTAKYVFASQIARAFARDPLLGMALGVSLQVNIGVLSVTPRLQARPAFSLRVSRLTSV